MLTSTNSFYSDRNSKFHFNAAFEGRAIFSEKSTTVLSNTKFELNYANETGALNIQAETNTENLTNLNSTQNYAADHAGAIKIISSSAINLTGNIFLENNSAEASAIYLLVSELDNIAKATIFQRNNASNGKTLVVMFSFITIESSSFLDNNFTSGTTGVFVKFSRVFINGITLDNSANRGFSSRRDAVENSAITGGALMINFESALIITNSSISNCIGKDGGGTYLSGNSTITASNFIIMSDMQKIQTVEYICEIMIL